MAKKVLLAVVPSLLEKVDFIAKSEFRTRSDLMREAMRRYIENYERTNGSVLINTTTTTDTVPMTTKELTCVN